MSERNRFGLARTVPAAVRREVRQRCGYGCVRCGLALYDYEHFDPDFKDATQHLATGITLLCMQCNQKRRRGMLSLESVREANALPKCLEQGYASEIFDLGADHLEVVFAGVTFKDTTDLIVVNGFSILKICPPESARQPFRLSGFFADSTGQVTLKIHENVWSAGADNWDVECVGPRITIRRGPKDITLVLRADPPNRLIVERLNMEFEGVHFRGSAEMLETSFDGSRWSTWRGVRISKCQVGISMRNRRD